MIGILTAACAPAIALLTFFYLKDEFEQEPVHMVIRCFVFGALLVFPAMFTQYVISEETSMTSPLFHILIETVFIEEFFKWFTVLGAVYFHVHFNQRYDGIVYAVAVGLGFAAMENIFYLLANGLESAFLRAVFPVTSHALFGVVMGYYFGLAKFSKHKFLFLSAAVVLPYIFHSIYNAILIHFESWSVLIIPFMIFLWIFAMHKVKLANRQHSNSDEAVPWRFS
ncbi:glutamic-type intramembrane protease PrsW [Alkalicoccus halolimnae]|uniref:Protease PrsW n=1 Tax=Alkalicoccus halolimnae TaxID=1667239 RepID=A0A5C7FFC5_9BACI|nr:glutamic-type intramembrane protease PrsW [Alkalicoccus halolimnae]TXF83024.1 intramembrane metalloprotease PrsW [Alkalicoccus halolimnae]